MWLRPWNGDRHGIGKHANDMLSDTVITLEWPLNGMLADAVITIAVIGKHADAMITMACQWQACN
jgi:hypothetical protein